MSEGLVSLQVGGGGDAKVAILIFFLSKNKPETSAKGKASEAPFLFVWAPFLLQGHPLPAGPHLPCVLHHLVMARA